jgi:hypothetical protein
MNLAFPHPRARVADAPPRVRIRLNRRRLWRWQLWLVEALAAAGAAPELVFADGAPLPRPLRLLLALERLVFGLAGEHASDLLDVAAFSALGVPAHGTADVVLDLAAAPDEAGEGALRLHYDGVAGEDALIGALLEGRRVQATVADASRPLASGLAAVEDPRVLTRALDTVFSTLLRLCRKAIESPAAADLPAGSSSAGAAARPGILKTARFAAATLAGKASAKLTHLCLAAPAWHIRWRWTDGGRVALTHRLPQSGFARLADDGGRYYADPFVLERAGVHHVFCEEFDYALGKGFISATTIARDGTPARPRPVLEAPHHLSYPFVFEHGGTTWMVPESGTARSVDLYRADPFPHRWVHEATLLSGIQAADATLLVHAGEWWMFAATTERQSSSWDALCLFHSPDLKGPWRAHPQNPVLIDAGAARPAGRIFRADGVLWRPAQDCRADYGAALALCAIERLDRDGYQQTVRTRLRFEAATRGPHTLNWAAGLEVIDELS